MDWLKKNYERVLLGVAAVALLACAGLVISSVQSFPDQFAGRDSTKPKISKIEPYPTEVIASAEKQLKSPRNWTSHEGSLFISRPYVLTEGKLVNPMEGGEDLHPPIKNSWLIQYDLPYWERDIREQDADGDRFSNLEEFIHGTDPRNPESLPPYYTKLSLEKFITVPFRLRFTGSPDQGHTFTINALDNPKSRTQFLELGQMIKDAPYKLISYTPKKVTENEIEKDVSELLIENTQTGAKITLVANKVANDPTSFAEFLYRYDGSTFKVEKDHEFSLKPEEDHKYKLIDITENKAVIQDQKTKEQFEVTKVAPAQ